MGLLISLIRSETPVHVHLAACFTEKLDHSIKKSNDILIRVSLLSESAHHVENTIHSVHPYKQAIGKRVAKAENLVDSIAKIEDADVADREANGKKDASENPGEAATCSWFACISLLENLRDFPNVQIPGVVKFDSNCSIELTSFGFQCPRRMAEQSFQSCLLAHQRIS